MNNTRDNINVIEEKFISYFNNNFIKINGLWRFLYNYSHIVLFLTKAVIGVGLLITIYITNEQLNYIMVGQFNTANFVRAIILIISLLLLMYLIYLNFKSPKVDDKFVHGNPFYRVKKIIYYWSPILYMSIMIIAGWFDTLWGEDHKGFVAFVALTMPPTSIIYSRLKLQTHYKARVFREFVGSTLIDCKYRDFVDGKLPDVNSPMLEINQKLLVQVILHPRNEYEKGLIQFINQANEGLVWSLYNTGIADKLRENSNTLTVEVSEIGEFWCIHYLLFFIHFKPII